MEKKSNNRKEEERPALWRLPNCLKARRLGRLRAGCLGESGTWRCGVGGVRAQVPRPGGGGAARGCVEAGEAAGTEGIGGKRQLRAPGRCGPGAGAGLSGRGRYRCGPRGGRGVGRGAGLAGAGRRPVRGGARRGAPAGAGKRRGKAALRGAARRGGAVISRARGAGSRSVSPPASSGSSSPSRKTWRTAELARHGCSR